MQISPSQIIAECQEISRCNEAAPRVFVATHAEDQILRLHQALEVGTDDPAVTLALRWWQLEQAMGGHQGDIPEALTEAQGIVEQMLGNTRASTFAGLEAKLRIALVGSTQEREEMAPADALVLSVAEDVIGLESASVGRPEVMDASLDAGLLRMESMAAEGDKIMNRSGGDDESGLGQWGVNYAGLCQTPAWTLAGLAVKVRALMTEITEGESFCGDDLRRTTDEALKRLIG